MSFEVIVYKRKICTLTWYKELRLLRRRSNMQSLNHQEIPTNEGRIMGDSLFYISRKLGKQGKIACLHFLG